MVKDIAINEKDLLWLAGLIDGDGCFRFLQKPDGTFLTCSIVVKMVDEDVVQRAAALFSSSVSCIKSQNIKHKNIFCTRLLGHNSVSLMKLLYPYMSSRRQKKIDDIFESLERSKKELKVQDSVDFLKNLRKTKSCREIGLLYGVSGETIRMMTLDRYSNHSPLHFSCPTAPSSHTNSLHWLAGLLEAEGSFMKGNPSNPNQAIISIQMTDKDVMENVASFFGTTLSSYTPKGRTKDNTREFKKVYLCQLRGTRARKLMTDLKPLMGVRRQAQIQKALDSYNPNALDDANKKKMVISDSELGKIYKARQSGETLERIAFRYGVTRNVIRRACERYGKIT